MLFFSYQFFNHLRTRWEGEKEKKVCKMWNIKIFDIYLYMWSAFLTSPDWKDLIYKKVFIKSFKNDQNWRSVFVPQSQNSTSSRYLLFFRNEARLHLLFNFRACRRASKMWQLRYCSSAPNQRHISWTQLAFSFFVAFPFWS